MTLVTVVTDAGRVSRLSQATAQPPDLPMPTVLAPGAPKPAGTEPSYASLLGRLALRARRKALGFGLCQADGDVAMREIPTPGPMVLLA